MDFPDLRGDAIDQARSKLRSPISPDKVLVMAWRVLEERPRAIEEWLFQVVPHQRPETARKRIAEKGRDAWSHRHIGANMDEVGWEALHRVCNWRSPSLKKLAENACKNLKVLLGEQCAAAILDAAGGLQSLARMTQRDCLNLGREFINPQSKGFLQLHELATSDRALRILSSRVILAARLDAYGNHFKGDSLRQEVLYAQ